MERLRETVQRKLAHRRRGSGEAGNSTLNVPESSSDHRRYSGTISGLRQCQALPVSHDSLRATAFFKHRDPEFLDLLLESISFKMFLPGNDIIIEGEIGDAMYFLHRGDVEVLVGPDQKRVAQLSDGSIFGEMALLGYGARKATIRATSICDCRIIHAAPFNTCLKRFPVEKKYFVQMAKERIAELHRAQAIEKMKHFSQKAQQGDKAKDAAKINSPSTTGSDGLTLSSNIMEESSDSVHEDVLTPLESRISPKQAFSNRRVSTKKKMSISLQASPVALSIKIRDLTGQETPSSGKCFLANGAKPIKAALVEEDAPSSLQVSATQGNSAAPAEAKVGAAAPDGAVPQFFDEVQSSVDDDAKSAQCSARRKSQPKQVKCAEENMPGIALAPADSEPKAAKVLEVSEIKTKVAGVEQQPSTRGRSKQRTQPSSSKPTENRMPSKSHVAEFQDNSAKMHDVQSTVSPESEPVDRKAEAIELPEVSDTKATLAGVELQHSARGRSKQKTQTSSLKRTKETSSSKSQAAPIQGNSATPLGKMHDAHSTVSPELEPVASKKEAIKLPEVSDTKARLAGAAPQPSARGRSKQKTQPGISATVTGKMHDIHIAFSPELEWALPILPSAELPPMDKTEADHRRYFPFLYKEMHEPISKHVDVRRPVKRCVADLGIW